MKEVNLEITQVHVEPRIIKTDWKWTIGTPIFAMSKGARKQFGLKKDKKYQKWQKQMKKLWKKRSTN